jgi:hypothetical protein
MGTQVYSRFTQTEPVLFDGRETYGRWKSPLTPAIYNNLLIIVVNVRYEGRPDLIANELYGNPSLDWMLIAVNNATDALNWPRAGTTINVPNPSTISSELL